MSSPILLICNIARSHGQPIPLFLTCQQGKILENISNNFKFLICKQERLIDMFSVYFFSLTCYNQTCIERWRQLITIYSYFDFTWVLAIANIFANGHIQTHDQKTKIQKTKRPISHSKKLDKNSKPFPYSQYYSNFQKQHAHSFE